MILFQKLRYKNFLSTGDVFTELDLTKSESTLVVGQNGAGKSTFLDALHFALYNKPFRNISKPQLVNSMNGKGLMVELEFNIGNQDILVRRGIKPNKFQVLIDGKEQNEMANVRDQQSWFEKNIVQMDMTAFRQVVVLGSANYTPFMQLPSMQRRSVIEELLGINIFTTMNLLLKDHIQTNKDSIGDNNHSIDKVEIEINVMDQFKDQESKKRKQQIEQLDSKRKVTQDSILTVHGMIEDLQTKVYEKQESIADEGKVKETIDQMRSIYAKVEDKIHRLEKEIEFFESNDQCPTCEQSFEPEFKEKHVCKRRDSKEQTESGLIDMDTELSKRTDRLNDIATIVSEINNLNQQISQKNGELTGLQRTLEEVVDTIANLSSDTSEEDDNKKKERALKKQLKELTKIKEELSNEREVLKVASVLLKDGGIKAKIIKQYIPIMNKLINKYLASMDFFVNFELDEEFNETIKSRFRDAFSYDSFSEGEKMRIDLALLFTWRAIAKLRNSASTNLLIMDEVFDSSLDNTGTDELLRIINDLTKDTNTFIISHKGDQLFDKFANVIKFEKSKNFSRIAA
jgi:DNA repair exonuclease SbcCD ATPase subunit